jgi:hypothetical protein
MDRTRLTRAAWLDPAWILPELRFDFLHLRPLCLVERGREAAADDHIRDRTIKDRKGRIMAAGRRKSKTNLENRPAVANLKSIANHRWSSLCIRIAAPGHGETVTSASMEIHLE